MALTYHVTVGGAYLSTYTGAGWPGGTGALEPFGVPEEGVLVAVTKHEKLIMTDVSGPEAPAEIQDMGMTALITCTLIAYDVAVGRKLERAAGQASAGLSPAIGTLLGTNVYDFALLVQSLTDEPWTFPHTKIRTFSRKPSSTRNEYDFEAFAWGFVPASTLTSSGIVVYTN